MPKFARRAAKSPISAMEDPHTGHEGSHGLLKTIDKSLEDIRAVITCRVCVRPLYEPFTIECGHTFCYSCLVSWFEKNTAHKSCPDCRAKITRKPAAAYLVRDITQLFSNRAELLPAGETTQEHQDQQREEARILEQDRNGRGLFRNSFRHEERFTAAFGNRIIIDDEDGVSRCPRCTWEMEDDTCAGCGWPGDADSWDLDSGSGTVSDEDEFFRREMGIDGDEYGYENGIPSSAILDDEDDEERDSAGSLDGFVVNDEQVQEARHRIPGTGQAFHWRPILRPYDSQGGHSRPPASSAGIPTSEYESDSQALDHTSDDNADAPSLFGGRSSRSKSSDSHSNDSPPATFENPPLNARSARYRILLDDSDGDSIIPLPTAARNSGRRRPNRVRSSGRGGTRPISSDATQIVSDSSGPLSRSRTRRSRDASNIAPISDHNSNGLVQYLVSDNEYSPRTVQQRTMHRNADPLQAMRRRAARPIVADEDEDEYDDEDMSTAVKANEQQLDDTLRGPLRTASGPPQQQGRALTGTLTSNQCISEQFQNDIHPTLRLDPATSIPIRRENANMPGAFPPSFVSEQGQSQSTPPVNSGVFTSPSLPDRSSASRTIRAPEENEQAFLDRRRRQEQTTRATHMQQTRRRERSAAKAARRQERQRVKAELDARGRRSGEPSALPLMTQ